jgi:purine catabolism regulator
MLRAPGNPVSIRNGRSRPAKDSFAEETNIGGMTVRAALDAPSLVAGAPEVVSGEGGLDREIRWAHAGDSPHLADQLRGGELVLSTGLALGRDAKAQRRFAADLSDRDVAALVLELGQVFTSPPSTLVKAAREKGLTMVVLHREIPFVEATEAINQGLLDERLLDVKQADGLQRQFTALMLEGAGIPEVLGTLAASIESPVILEREGGELLYHAPHAHDSADVLSAWDMVNRHLPGAPDSLHVDIPTSGGEPHSRLVAIALGRPVPTLARPAMERAADLLALVTLQSRQEEILIARERGNLLARFLETDLAESEIARQVDAMGFPRRVPYLMPCVLAATGPGRAPRASAAALWSSVWRQVKRELDGRRIPVLGGLMPSAHELGMMVGLATSKQRDERADMLADLFSRALEREIGSETAGLLFVGDSSANWTRAVSSLREVAEAARTPRVEGGKWYDATSPDLERLLWALRDSNEMLSFVLRRIGPLVEHDKDRSAMLTATLETFLECGGNKTETARKLHLERQSLYHRLARIESLIGASLDDEDTRLGLHLAIRARRLIPGIDQDLT